MAEDPRFSDILAQIKNHAEGVRLIEQWTLKHTTAQVISALEAKKIPCGVAYTIEQVNNDENLKARGMFQRVYHPVFGDIDVPGFPFIFSLTKGSIRMPAPALGEHSRLILEKWLGYSPHEVEELLHQGVIFSPADEVNS